MIILYNNNVILCVCFCVCSCACCVVFACVFVLYIYTLSFIVHLTESFSQYIDIPLLYHHNFNLYFL